jgi:putative ABC transport system ATP-binding protein/lipoprotein-releasing system ATP-binding protein
MAENQTRSPLVQASALWRVFKQGDKEIAALMRANCIVDPGDHIAITGPSGSGKSTLLNLLAGLDVPTSGRLSWPAHQERQPLRPAYLSIALQMPNLLPALTAVENIALPLLLMQSPPDEAQTAAYRLMEQLDLTDLADQFPEELSGGQAQRVVLARSLVTHPRLILADEPTGQLDHPTAHHLFDLLFAILEQSDTALVIATHDRAVAERMSTQWKMERGVLQA